MKKFLTLALALLMVCMMLPVVAMAEEGAEGAGASNGPVEYWAGFTADTKKESFATLEEAFAYAQATEQANDGSHRVVIATNKEYEITTNMVIPKNTYLDVLGKLTIAEGVTVTVPANAKRLAAWSGGTIEGAGKVLVEGRGTYLYNESSIMVNGAMNIDMIIVPEGYMLSKNNSSYFAAKAEFKITYSDGTTKNIGKGDAWDGAARVTLLDNVNEFTKTISGVADGFVLDLGGYTLSGKSDASTQVLSISVPMTIQNGTIKYASSNKNCGALITSADVTIASNVTIDGGDGYGVWTDGYGHTLTVNGTIISNGYYAITSNGSENGNLVTDSSIIINKGAVVSVPNGIAIYHPEKGTVTINGGEISGHTGVEMCAGDLIVNGGSITSTGANMNATGSQNAIMDGAAISVINRNYPGGIPTAKINGGTIRATGNGALAVKAYDYKGDVVAEWMDASEYVEVNGGTFYGEVNDLEKYIPETSEVVSGESDGFVVRPKNTTIVIIRPTEEEKPAEDTKNPNTGANDLVGVAVALAVAALVSGAAVSMKKDNL